jgi:hypothetical protein
MSLLTSILQKIAPQMGVVVAVEPEYKLAGHITFKNGNKDFYNTRELNINLNC